MEIAEEEEEEERERKRQSIVKEERGESLAGDVEVTPTSPAAAQAPVTLNFGPRQLTGRILFAGRREPPEFNGIARPSSPAKSFDDAARRMSSQTARTDLYSYSSYPYSKAESETWPSAPPRSQ